MLTAKFAEEDGTTSYQKFTLTPVSADEIRINRAFSDDGIHYRLVDLPGYGFAQVSARKRRHWGDLLSDYFRVRESLRGLILVVDIRRKLTDYDRQMMEFAGLNELPIHILLTKADKLKRGQAAKAEHPAKSHGIQPMPSLRSAPKCSSSSRLAALTGSE